MQLPTSYYIISSGDQAKRDTPNLKTKFNILRKHVIINLYYPIEWCTKVIRLDLKTHIQQISKSECHLHVFGHVANTSAQRASISNKITGIIISVRTEEIIFNQF